MFMWTIKDHNLFLLYTYRTSSKSKVSAFFRKNLKTDSYYILKAVLGTYDGVNQSIKTWQNNSSCTVIGIKKTKIENRLRTRFSCPKISRPSSCGPLCCTLAGGHTKCVGDIFRSFNLRVFSTSHYWKVLESGKSVGRGDRGRERGDVRSRHDTGDGRHETGDMRQETCMRQRRETGDVRVETWGWRRETGDVKEETRDRRRHEKGDVRQETWDVRMEAWDRRCETGDKRYEHSKIDRRQKNGNMRQKIWERRWDVRLQTRDRYRNGKIFVGENFF